MTELQRKEFLRKMGYSGSCLHKTFEEKEEKIEKIEKIEKVEKEKKEKVDTRVDKNELLALHKLFSQKKEPIK